MRVATPADLAFVVHADLDADGPPPTEAERRAHRDKIAAYLTDPDKGAYVEVADGGPVGAILARFRDLDAEEDSPENRLLVDRVLADIDPGWMPADRRFTEVFNLWVAPEHRRRGIATRLKLRLEQESRRRGIGLVYTHTAHDRTDVIALNERLGYVVVRRGTIWDAVVRVSLVKRLGPGGGNA